MSFCRRSPVREFGLKLIEHEAIEDQQQESPTQLQEQEVLSFDAVANHAVESPIALLELSYGLVLGPFVEDLVRIYFQTIHPCYPVIDEFDFDIDFSQTIDDETLRQSRATVLCAIFLCASMVPLSPSSITKIDALISSPAPEPNPLVVHTHPAHANPAPKIPFLNIPIPLRPLHTLALPTQPNTSLSPSLLLVPFLPRTHTHQLILALKSLHPRQSGRTRSNDVGSDDRSIAIDMVVPHNPGPNHLFFRGGDITSSPRDDHKGKFQPSET